MGHISLIFMKIASNERGVVAVVVMAVDHPSIRPFIDASVSDVSEQASVQAV